MSAFTPRTGGSMLPRSLLSLRLCEVFTQAVVLLLVLGGPSAAQANISLSMESPAQALPAGSIYTFIPDITGTQDRSHLDWELLEKGRPVRTSDPVLRFEPALISSPVYGRALFYSPKDTVSRVFQVRVPKTLGETFQLGLASCARESARDGLPGLPLDLQEKLLGDFLVGGEREQGLAIQAQVAGALIRHAAAACDLPALPIREMNIGGKRTGSSAAIGGHGVPSHSASDLPGSASGTVDERVDGMEAPDS